MHSLTGNCIFYVILHRQILHGLRLLEIQESYHNFEVTELVQSTKQLNQKDANGNNKFLQVLRKLQSQRRPKRALITLQGKFLRRRTTTRTLQLGEAVSKEFYLGILRMVVGLEQLPLVQSHLFKTDYLTTLSCPSTRILSS